MSDIWDIQTSSGDRRRHQDRRFTGLESVKSGFSLSLSSISVNRGGSVALSTQKVAKRVGHPLGLDENQNQTSGLLSDEKVKQKRLLVTVVDVLDSLGDIF